MAYLPILCMVAGINRYLVVYFMKLCLKGLRNGSKKIRDLSLICLDKDTTLVVACDSRGGIGSKKGDILKVSPFYVFKFISRVPIMEALKKTLSQYQRH